MKISLGMLVAGAGAGVRYFRVVRWLPRDRVLLEEVNWNWNEFRYITNVGCTETVHRSSLVRWRREYLRSKKQYPKNHVVKKPPINGERWRSQL